MKLSYNCIKLICFHGIFHLCALYYRRCPLKKQTQEQKKCSFDRWEDNWTLVAKNHLGKHNLTDFAQLSHRGNLLEISGHRFGYYNGPINSLFICLSTVHPVAPINLVALVHPWNATILWEWEYNSYSSFALVCEVEVNRNKTKVRHLCTGRKFVCLPECTESILNAVFSLMRVNPGPIHLFDHQHLRY